MAAKYFGCQLGCQGTKKAGFVVPALVRFASRCGLFCWLGSRDSNPNYLIQSQASYR